MNLGELERAVMEALWDAGVAMTAREVTMALADRDPAPTTVLTVLSRLEEKKLVSRTRDGRAHHYLPAASREEHIAGAMHQVLSGAGDRTAALLRFADGVDPDEAQALRAALDEAVRRSVAGT